MSMYEVNEAARVITSSADPNARIIFGSVIDESMGDELKITVIATGFGKGQKSKTKRIEATRVTPFEDPVKKEPIMPRSEPVEPVREVPKEEVPKKSKEEEELEIPAFIRKKMM